MLGLGLASRCVTSAYMVCVISEYHSVDELVHLGREKSLCRSQLGYWSSRCSFI